MSLNLQYTASSALTYCTLLCCSSLKSQWTEFRLIFVSISLDFPRINMTAHDFTQFAQIIKSKVGKVANHNTFSCPQKSILPSLISMIQSYQL